MPAAKRPKKTASGYRMPEHLDEGTVLRDLMKKEWTLGASIGMGGFGEIYLAAEGTKPPTKDNAKHVVKIEPKENGPLFVEMHFYISVGTAEQMKGWSGEVNMPLMRGQGSYKHKDDTYRFLVIDRFGTDLDKHFMNGKNTLSEDNIGTAAVQIINTLEYIHSKGYTHNDVKAANLLFGLGKESTKLHLVDFGLCVKYIKPEGHKEYKPDPRKAHDGTIEYLSRDAHIGCTSRRSDLEVLCYNLYHWFTGTLPWSKLLTNPLKVEGEKNKFMESLSSNIAHLPKSVQKLFLYVKSLDFQEKPDYKACRDFFKAEMKSTGGKFIISQSSAKVKTPKARKHSLERPAAKQTPRGRAKKPAKVESADEEVESEDDMFAAKKPPPRRRAKKAAIVESADEDDENIVEESESDEDMFAATPPAKQPRNGLIRERRGTPQSAKSTPNVKPVTKYKEAGCQTSPGFVASARKANKQANGDSAQKKSRSSAGTPRSEKAVNGKSESGAASSVTPRGVGGGKTPRGGGGKKKTKTEPPPPSNGIANPTPAMLEIMRRKQEIEAEKAAKKRKK